MMLPIVGISPFILSEVVLENAMKIEGKPTERPLPTASGVAARSASSPSTQAGPAVANANAKGATASGSVAVTVSERARALAQAKLESTSDVDMDKVESVRSAIENGTYQVNPEAIADKLLANAKEMLGRTRN